MDKMGSSFKVVTKGIPATPRAGAPVELVGLLKHCLTAYDKLYKEEKYSYNEIIFKHQTVKYSTWAERI
jgi:glycogen debranching enzyme